jgi:MFS superfamily sulfate permease-like transporter
MIVANSATALVYLLGSEAIRQLLPNIPGWALPVLIVFSLLNLVYAIALFQWKKWGFWGFCASSVAALVVNLSLGIGIGSVLSGLVGVIVLYGVLHIGKENKGWPQLK